MIIWNCTYMICTSSFTLCSSNEATFNLHEIHSFTTQQTASAMHRIKYYTKNRWIDKYENIIMRTRKKNWDFAICWDS